MRTGSDIISAVLDRLLSDIHCHVDDNHDHERFPEGPIARSQAAAGESKSTLNMILSNADKIADAYNILQDGASQSLMMDLLAYRLAGQEHVKLQANNDQHWAARNDAKLYAVGPSQIEAEFPFCKLYHHKIPFLGCSVDLDCPSSALAWSFLLKQYFFDRGGVRIAPEPGDVVIDGGACLGDSALAFAAAVGESGHVHAFDLCSSHLKVMAHNLSLNPWAKVSIYPFGVSNRDRDGDPLPVETIVPWLSVDRVKDWPLPLRRIDTLVESGAIEKVNFIKLDVEGAEIDALEGSLDTIRKFRPKLAVSIYHKPQDIFSIPAYINSLDLGYKMYIDHYTIFNEETVLFACVD